MSIRTIASSTDSTNEFFDRLPHGATFLIFEYLKGEDGFLSPSSDDKAIMATARVCRHWQNNHTLNLERQDASARLCQHIRLKNINMIVAHVNLPQNNSDDIIHAVIIKTNRGFEMHQNNSEGRRLGKAILRIDNHEIYVGSIDNETQNVQHIQGLVPSLGLVGWKQVAEAAHKVKGVGQKIMDQIFKYSESLGKNGKIVLSAQGGSAPFYLQYGFEPQPTANIDSPYLNKLKEQIKNKEKIDDFVPDMVMYLPPSARESTRNRLK